MKKARLEDIEILRGVAFLAVVLQHVIAGVFYQPGVTPVAMIMGTSFLGLTRFAVPLFVFITGLVLFYNYDGKLNYVSFLRKRFKQVVLPYLAWTLFYYVWVSFLSGVAPSTTWNELLNLIKVSLTGKASYHLWFMVMIIPFYILIPLFRVLISKERKGSINLIVVLAFFGVNLLLVYGLSKGLITSGTPQLGFIFDYLDRNFLFWIFYFLLGGLAGLYYEAWKKFIHKSKYIGIAVLLVCFYPIVNHILNINRGATDNRYLFSANVTAPLKPLMLVTITVLILLVFSVVMRVAHKQTKSTKLLYLFGKYSFGTYLIHAFVLRFTNHLAVDYLSMLDVFSQSVVSFVLCSSISLFLTIWLSKMKITVGEIWVGKV